MVQRYDIEEMSGNPWESYRCIEENDDGDYVKYEDYAKLANDFLFVAFGVKDAEENPVDDDVYNAAVKFIDESGDN